MTNHVSIYELIGMAVVVFTSAFGASMILVFSYRGVKHFISELIDEHYKDVIEQAGRQIERR